MKKSENKDTIKNVVIVLLIIGIVILIPSNIPNKESCLDVAMLRTEYLGLYENLYDSTEMFFDYRLDNYGKVEARNVKVNCKIWDRNDNEISSVIDSVGNVASNSFYLGEAVTENIEIDEEGAITCYVESCNNCKILYKEIPKLVEYFRTG